MRAGGKHYGHIIDPRTGWSAGGVSSVTVVSRSEMTCDAWGTGLFVMGSKEARRIAKTRDDIAIIVVDPSTHGHFLIWAEESLRNRVDIDAATTASDEVRFF